MTDLSIKKPMFGKEIEITLSDIDETLAKIPVQIAYEEGLRLSKIFNFYDEKSEISELNRKRTLKVSDELLFLLKKAKDFFEISKGEYDPTFGKLFLARKKGETEPKLNCSFNDVLIDGNKIILNHPDVLIDLGSIAKGFIVDKIVETLESEGILDGFVDGRGDIRVFGEHEEIIGVQNPREDKIIKYIVLKNQAVATSGDYNQYSGNYQNSHIINQKDLISVTVVADDLMTADAFATILFVLEKREREKLISNSQNIKIMVINKNIQINYYNGFESLLKK